MLKYEQESIFLWTDILFSPEFPGSQVRKRNMVNFLILVIRKDEAHFFSKERNFIHWVLKELLLLFTDLIFKFYLKQLFSLSKIFPQYLY